MMMMMVMMMIMMMMKPWNWEVNIALNEQTAQIFETDLIAQVRLMTGIHIQLNIQHVVNMLVFYDLVNSNLSPSYCPPASLLLHSFSHYSEHTKQG